MEQEVKISFQSKEMLCEAKAKEDQNGITFETFEKFIHDLAIQWFKNIQLVSSLGLPISK